MQDKISVKLAKISGPSRQVGTGPFPSFHLLEVYDIQSIHPSPEPDGVYNPRLTARLVLNFPDSGAYPPRSAKKMESFLNFLILSGFLFIILVFAAASYVRKEKAITKQSEKRKE